MSCSQCDCWYMYGKMSYINHWESQVLIIYKINHRMIMITSPLLVVCTKSSKLCDSHSHLAFTVTWRTGLPYYMYFANKPMGLLYDREKTTHQKYGARVHRSIPDFS